MAELPATTWPHPASWRVWVKYFSIFSLTFSMQTRKWRWHVPQSKGLAFFFLSASGAVEEALKTAKSSAAAANKYAIFLLSCLSGCQPFAVRHSLYSSLAPAARARAGAVAGSMPDSSWRSNRTANKKVKQSDGRISMQFDVCVHLLLLLPLFCFPFSFFPHIPFDWISIWLQFFVSAGRYLIVEWLIVWVLLAFHVAHFVVSQSSCLQSSLGAVCFCNIDGWLDWQADELVCKILQSVCYACG